MIFETETVKVDGIKVNTIKEEIEKVDIPIIEPKKYEKIVVKEEVKEEVKKEVVRCRNVEFSVGKTINFIGIGLLGYMLFS